MSSQATADGLLGLHRGKPNTGKTTTASSAQRPPLTKEDILSSSIGKPRKKTGGDIDVMNYCNAEMELPLEKHFDIMRQVDGEEDDVGLNFSTEEGDDSNNSSSSSSTKENNSSNNTSSTSLANDNSEKKYRPLPTRKPNRDSSLLECDTKGYYKKKQQGVIMEETRDDKVSFHPALRPAVCAEGQEVMWREDEFSTVSSVMLQPKPQAMDTIIEPPHKANTEKPPQRHRLPFFHRNKQQTEKKLVADARAVKTTPIKVHVKRKKVKKSVVLLPQEDNPNKEELMDIDASASAEQETIKNMIKARELLNAALVLEETPRLEESEKMARFAFEHAQTARRLAESHSRSTRKHKERQEKGRNKDTSQEDLDHVLSYLAEQGQEAVYQHQKVVFSQSYEDEDNDDGKQELKRASKNSKKHGLGEYASKAVHYLESILPKNIGEQDKEDGADVAKLGKAGSAEDFWSDAGISTLGMNNDTFEYGLSCGIPSLPPLVQTTTSKFNMDLVSLSSLNEILDGPMDDENPAKEAEKNDKSSPPDFLPVIDVPNRKPSRKNHKTPKQSSILGLITPSAKKHGLKNLLTPRKNFSTTDGSFTQATKKVKNSKKWNKLSMFPAKKPEEAVDCPDIIEEESDVVEEESDVVEAAEESKSDFQSDLAALHVSVATDSNIASPDIEGPLVEEKHTVISLREIKSESTDSQGSKGEERYNPHGSTDGMNVSTSATFKGPLSTSNKSMKEQAAEEWDESVYQRNIHELQSISVAESGHEMSNSKSEFSISKADERSDWDESFHLIPSTPSKHSEEPVGKTPRRDRHDIEPSLSRLNEAEGIFSVPSREVSKIVDFDMGSQRNTKQSKPASSAKGKKLKKNTKEKGADLSQKELAKPEFSTSEHGKCTFSSDNTAKGAELFLPGKSGSVHSDGSKTKIFGKIVDMIGSKKKPLIPTAVIEETYVVPARTKKPTNNDNKQENKEDQIKAAKKVDGRKKMNKKEKESSKENEPGLEGTRKDRVNQAQSTANPSSSITVYGDSTVVIEQAVSNGNLKAIQSNEEDEEAPANYLAMMLKKKAKEERQKSREDTSVDTERSPIDADSFVAAIRGPRHQECPGVALEGMAARIARREPNSSESGKYEIRNLAPTPRRPEQFKSLDGIKTAIDHDPPLDDTRERQRMITERLYAAGSSSFDDANNSNKLFDSCTPTNDKYAEDDRDLLEMVPTVDSAASYEYEAGTEVEIEDTTNASASAAEAMVEECSDFGANDDDRKSTRKNRLSFLPGMFKLKI